MWLHRPLVIAVVLAAGAAGCGHPAPADLVPVPTSAAGNPLGPTACPTPLLEGDLVADEESGFFVAHADGFSSAVIWLHGYVARNAPRRELLDDSGRVVARAGDHVALGGGEGSAGPGFVVCGQLDVTRVP